MGVVVLGELDQAVRDHLRVALAAHFKWCRTQELAVPVDLRALFDWVDRGGQARPARAPVEAAGDDAAMRLALTYEQAGERLGVSSRTIRRLVEAGTLPAVEVASARRIRATDLVAFTERMETA